MNSTVRWATSSVNEEVSILIPNNSTKGKDERESACTSLAMIVL